MVSAKVKITNPTGLHLRPAGKLCNVAVNYKSSITFKYAKGIANVKSVLSVLGACVRSGEELEFVCNGSDEEEALEAIMAVIDKGLGE